MFSHAKIRSVALALSGVLFLGTLGAAPAFAEEPTLDPTVSATPEAPAPDETPAPEETSDPAPTAAAAGQEIFLSGEITHLSEEAHGASAETALQQLFHVQGQGYLYLDFSAVPTALTKSGSITVKLTVPGSVDLGATPETEFTALLELTGSGAALPVVALVTLPTVKGMVNQTPSTAGVHKIFAVLVTPSNVAGTTADASQTTANVRAAVDHVNTFWRSESANRVGFELVEPGPVAFYKSANTCATVADSTALWAEARTKAIAQLGYVDALNSHLVLFFPSSVTSECGGGIGLGTIGTSINSGGLVWSVGSNLPTGKATLAHELGHNMSFGHANWLDCADVAPYTGAFGTSGSCTVKNYYDIYDAMGFRISGKTGGSISSPNAIRAGLWASADYSVAPSGTTTYTINSVGSNTGKRAIVVEDNLGSNYFVEFRNFVGDDAQFTGGLGACDDPASACVPSTPGVRVLRLEQQNYNGTYLKGVWGDDTHLIGRTVDGVKLRDYKVGQSFTSQATGGVTIKVVQINATTAQVKVTRPANTTTQDSVNGNPFDSTDPKGVWVAQTLSYDGNIRVGDTLTAMIGMFWEADSYTYKWFRNGVAIAGATKPNYVLVPADQGKGIRLTVTGKSGTSTRSATAPSTVYSGYGPILPGVAEQGTVTVWPKGAGLTTQLIGWTSGASTSYKWFRDDVVIAGATGAVYVPTAADWDKNLKVNVTVSKAGFDTLTATTTNAKYSVNAVGTLAISGAAQIGQILSVNNLTYSTTATRAYQWFRTGAAIAGATTGSYRLVAADLGKAITARVIGSTPGYAPHTTTTLPTAAVTVGTIAGTLAIPVVSKTGLVLTGVFPAGAVTESDPTPATAWQWLRDGAAIALATKASYTLVAADFDKDISLRGTVTKPAYLKVVRESAAVNHSLLPGGLPTISGTPQVGLTLTATAPTYSTIPSSGGADSIAFQWYRTGVAIPAATASTYALVAADFGKTITVRTIGAKANYLPATGVSIATVAVAKGIIGGTHTTATATMNTAGTVLTAAPAAGAITEPGVAYAYQWYRNGVAIAKATKATFAVTVADRSKQLHVRIIVTKLNYTSVTLVSSPLNFTLVPSAPIVISGTAQVGKTLSVNATNYATFSGPVAAPVRAYQWYRSGVAIAGAINQTYTLVAADYTKLITVRVTGSAPGFMAWIGTTPATTKVVLGDIVGPNVISVVSRSGSVLTAALGSVGEAGTASGLQWFRGGVAVAKATKATYALTALDAGKQVHVRQLVTKLNYTPVSLLSVPTIYSVQRTVAPAYSGTVRVGETLTVNAGTFFTHDGGEFSSPTYQWLRSGVVIPGALGIGTTYTLLPADLGKVISVRVTQVATGYLSYVAASPGTVVAPGLIVGPYVVPVVQRSGNVLSVITPGSVGDIAVIYSYQWYRSGVAIAKATAATYKLTALDAGKLIHVRQLASRLAYAAVPLLSTPTIYSLQRTTAPAIEGTVRVAEVLSVNAGTFFTHDETSVEPTAPAYQWYRSGVAIAGATGSSYTLLPIDLAKVISVRLSKTQEPYLPYVAVSAPTVKVAAGIILGDTAVPRVDKDPATLILTATLPVESIKNTVGAKATYQWFRSGVAIATATAPTFKLTALDFNKAIHVRVTVTKVAYATVLLDSATTNASVVPLTALPVITGNVAIGQPLTVDPARTYTNDGVATYQWLRNGIAITLDGTGSSYTPVLLDKGKAISVRVVASAPGFLTSTSTSAATQLVADFAMAGGSSATVVPAPKLNGILTITANDTVVTEAGATKTHQWYRSGVAIAKATAATYTPVAADFGKQISVRVIYTKPTYTTVVRWSTPVAVSVIAVGKPAISSSLPKRGVTVSVSTPVFSSTESNAITVTYQWYRSGKAISGATRATYKPVTADKGKTLTVRVVASSVGLLPAVLASAATKALK